MTTVLANARIVTPTTVLHPGWISVHGDRITGLGTGDHPQADHIFDMFGRWVCPGFIDLHVHGGGGSWVTNGAVAEARAALEFHRLQGTTRTLASLVAAPMNRMESAAQALAELVDDGVLHGVHLEGPFLSPTRSGAQDAPCFVEPDRTVLDRLIAASRGTVRVVTVAPELPNATQLIKHIVASGAVAAIGHTDATYDQTIAAVDAGARLVTHIFNGMRPLHHREPGAAGAALDIEDLVCEVVADGIHMHDAALRLVYRVKGHQGTALITDAIAAAGVGDGVYQYREHRVRVSDGVARVAQHGSLAGSTLTMSAAVRNAVTSGLPVADAIRSASQTPATVLGIPDVGILRIGNAADLVVLENYSLNVYAVMTAGIWRRKPPPLQNGSISQFL